MLSTLLDDCFEKVTRTVDVSEQRAEPRFPLHLKVAIVYHQHKDASTRPTYHGKSLDISMNGLSVLVDCNINTDAEVTVLMALPPTHEATPQKIVEATAQMAYTVLSSQHDAFRIGLTFRKFQRNGAAQLREALSERFAAARIG